MAGLGPCPLGDLTCAVGLTCLACHTGLALTIPNFQQGCRQTREDLTSDRKVLVEEDLLQVCVVGLVRVHEMMIRRNPEFQVQALLASQVPRVL